MKNLIRNLFSRPIFQPISEFILSCVLKVLNIGDGQSVQNSGEMSVCSVLEKISGGREMIVFDIGAHTGEWVSLFKTSYKGLSKIYSFEPSKKAFESLVQAKPDVAENLAMGDREGEMYLEFGGSSDAYISANNTQSSESIRVATIDKYCYEKNISEIDFLKLDIEGYELKALKGARQMIADDKIKLIQFEFGAPSPEKYSMDEFFKFLSPKYTIFRILKHGIYPLKNYKHFYEILTVTNFLAVRNDLM